MLSAGFLTWLFNNPNILPTVAHNWLLGVLSVAAVIFLETGLVIFPFLPGDSLLFATGAFLGMNAISPISAIIIITLAAVAGDGFNFWLGSSALGRQLIQRGWVKPQHLAKTRAYFDRYGPLTITVGRFIPVVRTMAPFLAGLTQMRPRRFALYNAVGAVLWCSLLILAGYQMSGVDWVHQHIGWLSIGMVVLCMSPMIFHLKYGKTVLEK